MSGRVRPARGTHWSRPYTLLSVSQDEQAERPVAVPLVAVLAASPNLDVCLHFLRTLRSMFDFEFGRPSLDSSDHDL
jgi:hypothetical protein